MALYLLDTDICSYVIRNRPEAVRKPMNAVPLESQAISVVIGVRRSSNAKVNQTVVGAFLRHVSVLDWSLNSRPNVLPIAIHHYRVHTPP